MTITKKTFLVVFQIAFFQIILHSQNIRYRSLTKFGKNVDK